MTVRTLPLLRSRLLHFAVLGGALWLVAPAERDARRIVVSRTAVEDALAKARAERGRALAAGERREVVADVVAERILAAEGRRLGLGDDDVVVNARLATIMRDVVEETAPHAPPSSEEARAEPTTARPRLDVELAFVRKERPGAAGEASALASTLARGDAVAPENAPPPGIPQRATWTEVELARALSPAVAEHAAGGPTSTWSAPIATPWGFYMVRVLARRPPTDGERASDATEAVLSRRRAAARAAAVSRAARAYVLDVATPEGEPGFDVRDLAAARGGEGVD
jgi:hypothetical protein